MAADPSSSGKHVPESNPKQSSSVVSQTSDRPSIGGAAARRVWGAAALVTFAFTIFVGGWQWARPVPYPPPEWTSAWKYILPLEFHAEQKLPDFENGNIQTVEVVPKSDRVWIAGDAGLLAYSDDGFTWTTYDWDAAAGVPKKQRAATQPITSGPLASLVPSVLAASPPQARQGNPPPRVQSRTSQGQQQQSAGNLPPLQILKVGAIQLGNGDVAIEWITNLPASSQVEYGTTEAYGYGSSSNPGSSLVTEHQVVLTNLRPLTVYHFRVISVNSSGQSATSGDASFGTPAFSSQNVSITSPSPGATVFGVITLSARVGSAFRSVRFAFDGQNLVLRPRPGLFEQILDTTRLPNGTHSLVAIATDLKGNTATSESVTITVRNGVPLIPAPDFEAVFSLDRDNVRLIAARLDQFSTKDGGATWQKLPDRFSGTVGLRAVRVTHGVYPDEVRYLTPKVLDKKLKLQFTDSSKTLVASFPDYRLRAAPDWGTPGTAVASNQITSAFGTWGDGKTQAWICGRAPDRSGVILKTTDQGVNWSAKYSAAERLDDIVFQEDARHGWAVGVNGVILFTNDGGENWHPVTRSALGAAPGGLVGDERYWKFPAPWTLAAAILFLFFLHRAMQQSAAAPVPESIATKAVRDSPLEPGEPDALGLGRIAHALSGFLRNEGTEPPVTIAVNGEWGTGKSSLMNLLRKDLEKRRFCPVWFNAWHNQEEPSLMAAMLQAVRIEAVPPWFSNRPWLRFRSRLLARRIKNHAVLVAALAAGVALFWGYDSALQRHKKHGVAQELAEQYLKLFPPGISEDEAKRRQQTVDGLVQVAKKLAAIPNQPPEVRKKVEEITQEIAQLSQQLAQEAKVPADASAKLAAKVEGLSKLASTENKAPSNAEAQEREKTLTGVLEEARVLAQEIVSVTQKPASSGATSAETAGSRIRNLGIFGTILGFLGGLWRAITAFGANPASLLAALSGGTKKSALEEQTSFRKQFTKEFEEVSWALRPATLTIFIDDLDRCRPEKVSELLEAVNYVTTSGRCLVILALERKTVEASVGLAFQGIAEERNYGDPDGAGPDPSFGDGILGESRRRRAAFAKQYLDKLINIEVDVPKLSTERAAEVSRREQAPEIAAWRKWGRKIWAERWAALGIAAAVVLTIGGYYAGIILAPAEPVPQQAPPQSTAIVETNGGTKEATSPGKKEEVEKPVENPPPTAAQAPPPVYHEGGPAHPKTSSGGLWVLLVLIAAALGVVVRTIVYTHREDLRAVEKDSESFQAALKIWLPVVEARQPTPRSVKRFLNRVRFLACLQQPGPDGEGPTPIPESILIALAALYKIDPLLLSDPDQFVITRDLRRGLTPTKPIIETIERARRKHEGVFHNWGETAIYVTRFLELLPGFTQH